MAEDSRTSIAAEHGRYRALMEISSAIASQPNLQAALQSLRNSCQKWLRLIRLHSVVGRQRTFLRLLHSATVRTAQRWTSGPKFLTSRDRHRSALSERKPSLSRTYKWNCGRCPRSWRGSRWTFRTARTSFRIDVAKGVGRIGVCHFEAGEFGSDDLELMSSVSSHVAVALRARSPSMRPRNTTRTGTRAGSAEASAGDQ